MPFVSAKAAAGSQDLVPCRICGRQFAQDALMRHEPICKKVFNRKRQPFNSFKQRVHGTDIGTVKRQPLLKNQPVKKSNWRQHHEEFINAIQSAKQVTKAMQEGRPLPPPPPPSINPDYIQCPSCLRRFNEAAAAKHIKFCEEQATRRAVAAKITKQPMGKQPVTQRKKPTVAPLLPHEKRVQKVDNTEKSTPEAPHRTLQKSRKPLDVSPVKKSTGESGQQTQTRRWSGCLPGTR